MSSKNNTISSVTLKVCNVPGESSRHEFKKLVKCLNKKKEAHRIGRLWVSRE
jgi:hypothetical protein